MPKITKVFYSALANLGDYQNERVGMYATLEEGETPEAAIEELKNRVAPLCGPKLQNLRSEKYRLESAIDELQRKLADYENQWNAAAEFLRAQGIKPDAPNFPTFNNLLPAANISHEESGVVEGEYEEDDYEDEE